MILIKYLSLIFAMNHLSILIFVYVGDSLYTYDIFRWYESFMILNVFEFYNSFWSYDVLANDESLISNTVVWVLWFFLDM